MFSLFRNFIHSGIFLGGKCRRMRGFWTLDVAAALFWLKAWWVELAWFSEAAFCVLRKNFSQDKPWIPVSWIWVSTRWPSSPQKFFSDRLAKVAKNFIRERMWERKTREKAKVLFLKSGSFILPQLWCKVKERRHEKMNKDSSKNRTLNGDPLSSGKSANIVKLALTHYR